MRSRAHDGARRTRLRRATAAAGATAIGAALMITTAGPAFAAAGCSVVYKVASQWPGGFTGDVSITNLGDPVSTWSLEYDFGDAGQRVAQGWNGTYTQTGRHVTVASTHNGVLATNASTGTGFNGTWTAANPVPTAFSLNGIACTGAAVAPTVQITGPAANTRFTAPATIPITATAAASGSTISKVEFYHDGLLLGTDTTAPYSFSWAGVPAQTAAYRVQAISYDAAGTKSNTADVSVFVDASATPAIVTDTSSVALAAGGTGTFRVSLSRAPSAATTVAIARTTGATTISAAPASLTFTPANFATPQAVTVTATAAAAANTSATFTASATGLAPVNVAATITGAGGTPAARFTQLYNDIKNPANGYFSPEGVPYHSIETLIDEAPDQGHETTSEAFSYWLLLEAQFGRASGNWAPFNNAWATMEKYIIPTHADQPTNDKYNAGTPATYAAEHPLPSGYPSQLEPGVGVGSDPLAAELRTAYNTNDIYGMHWLLDVDNVYGFGHCGDGTTRVAYINTFQRGTQESTFETVPQPSCDTFTSGGPNGYLDLFTKDTGAPAKQWKYTNAPDADARAVQAAYYANLWATEQGKTADVSASVANAAKMGDYLRYSFYDKYFKNPGCASTSCAAGSGKSSSSQLLSWYYAWGGATDTAAGWAWRIGSSHDHMGYQNPLAAWALSNVPALAPKSATGKADWAGSLGRQMEFYQWLQSSEGAIAGGATNSWNGNYSPRPANVPTFYGLSYVEAPVYSDPPSNQWFGFQVWSLGRVAELYNATGDVRAKAILDKWVPWALANSTITATGYQIPSTLGWTGAPATWNPASPAANTNLHVTVVDRTDDVGVAGAYAKVLTYYAARSGNAAAKTAAKNLLDGIWTHKDSKGVSVTETRADYNRMDDVYNPATGQGIYIPPGWAGRMPNGDVIRPGVSFLDIRSWYRQDPDFPKVQAYLNGGPAPTFNYHRFWAQVDVATGYADFARLFPNG